jgi:hypothetical protein
VIAQNSNYNNFVKSDNNIKKNEKDTI